MYLSALGIECLLTLQHSDKAGRVAPNIAREKTGGCADGSKLPLTSLTIVGKNCELRADRAKTCLAPFFSTSDLVVH